MTFFRKSATFRPLVARIATFLTDWIKIGISALLSHASAELRPNILMDTTAHQYPLTVATQQDYDLQYGTPLHSYCIWTYTEITALFLLLPCSTYTATLLEYLHGYSKVYTALEIATFHDLTFALISQLGLIRNLIPHYKNSPNSEIVQELALHYFGWITSPVTAEWYIRLQIVSQRERCRRL